tara:strand:+ start:94 stop:357 length:264 start_codon:yes stop_codon:yes gene_type:complete
MVTIDMRKFDIILRNCLESGLSHHLSCKVISFAEAARHAYDTKAKLGHEWSIESVRAIYEDTKITASSEGASNSGRREEEEDFISLS